MHSSAKYFCHGSLLPGTTASKRSWVRRISSSCVIATGSPQIDCGGVNKKKETGKTRISGRMFILGNLPTCPGTTNRNVLVPGSVLVPVSTEEDRVLPRTPRSRDYKTSSRQLSK